MTSKDKAKELYSKYFSEIEFSEFHSDDAAAKQCAIIAVDSFIELSNSQIEFLSKSENEDDISFYEFYTTMRDYWLQVKYHLDRLNF